MIELTPEEAALAVSTLPILQDLLARQQSAQTLPGPNISRSDAEKRISGEIYAVITANKEAVRQLYLKLQRGRMDEIAAAQPEWQDVSIVPEFKAERRKFDGEALATDVQKAALYIERFAEVAAAV